MVTITVTLTLKQAEAICMAVSKVDPYGVYSCDVVKKIDTIAKEEMAKISAEKENKK